MKKFIIISLILAAGLTAYPQSSRSSRESKSKSRSSQVSSRSASKSNSSKQVKSSSSNKSRSQATKARSSSQPKSAVNRSSSSRSSSSKSVGTRSGSSNNRSAAIKSGNSASRSSGAVRSSSSSSRSQGAVKSGSSSRSSSANVASRSSRSSAQTANRSNDSNRSSRSSVKSDNKNVLQSTNSRSSVPSKVRNSERGRSAENAVRSNSRSSDNVARRTSGSSVSRSDRAGSSTYVSSDGRKFRHQNDDVFVRTKYRTDYRDINHLRNSRDFVRVHNHYYNWYSHRHVRRVVVHNHFYRPLAIEVRMHRYPYRVPGHLDLCWTPHLHYNFSYYYPLQENWRISYGDYIETASTYEAMNYVGSVKRVYGKVEEVYYSPEDKTYTLYYGAPYPYHDFSVVVPRGVAKSFSWSPSWYFEDEHVWVVGLIEMWEGKPEIVVHDEQQIRRY